MPSDLCPGCGEWGCDGECDPDYSDGRTCQFCGFPECDGSGYNCPDDYYQEYNLH